MARKTNRYRATADIKYSKAFPSWVTGAQFVIPFYPFRSFSRVFIGRSMRHLEARRNIRSRASSLSRSHFLSCSLALSLPWELNTVAVLAVLSDISTIAAYIKSGGRDIENDDFDAGEEGDAGIMEGKKNGISRGRIWIWIMCGNIYIINDVKFCSKLVMEKWRG